MIGEKRLPSVTEILGIVSKPYLISWANRMGLKGVDIREYNAELADLGTVVQCVIQGFLVFRNVRQIHPPVPDFHDTELHVFRNIYNGHYGIKTEGIR